MRLQHPFMNVGVVLKNLTLLIFILQLCACSQLEDILVMPSKSEVKNKDAIRFIESINKQSAQLESFQRLLENKTPVYETIKLKYSSKLGMFYFIPYQENGNSTVSGAVYYPVKYQMNENNNVVLTDFLHSAKLVNANIINQEIPITQRFLYAHDFAQLASNGTSVDTLLLAYEFLNNSNINISNTNETRLTRNKTRFFAFYEPYIAIDFYYETDYIGPNTDAIYGLSPTAVERMLRKAIWNQCLLKDGYILEHHFSKFQVAIPLSRLKDYEFSADHDYTMLIGDIARDLQMQCFGDSFSTTIQYTYEVFQTNFILSGDSKGNSTTIGTGGSTFSKDGYANKEEREGMGYDNIADDCNAIEHADSTKKWFSDLISSLYNAKKRKIGENNYITLSAFTDSVAKNNTIEYSVNVREYDDEGLCIEEIHTDNKANNVKNFFTPSTKTTIHNHGNQTPPSPLDLQLACEKAADSTYTRFQGLVVYADKDSAFYALQITDKAEAARMKRILRDEINDENDFKKDGRCYNLLKTYRKRYEQMSINEQQITKLALVINHFNANIRIVRHSIKKNDVNPTTVFGVSKDERIVKCN